MRNFLKNAAVIGGIVFVTGCYCFLRPSFLFHTSAAEQNIIGLWLAGGSFASGILIAGAIKLRDFVFGVRQSSQMAHKESKRSHLPGSVCPKCGAPLVGRIARRGRFSGKRFWGCSRYPACDGLRTP